jgi:hypothetical protein
MCEALLGLSAVQMIDSKVAVNSLFPLSKLLRFVESLCELA